MTLRPMKAEEMMPPMKAANLSEPVVVEMVVCLAMGDGVTGVAGL